MEIKDIKVDEKPYDKVKYTWVRYLVLFMIRNPFFRSKWLLWKLRNCKTHICYKNGQIVEEFDVRYITKFL